ncbi:MAG: hypothetical protein H0W43_14930, partial [Chthoniobacterales bacterium]|nr:hypothetical protein [Chthoniobacterales bacterium]
MIGLRTRAGIFFACGSGLCSFRALSTPSPVVFRLAAIGSGLIFVSLLRLGGIALAVGAGLTVRLRLFLLAALVGPLSATLLGPLLAIRLFGVALSSLLRLRSGFRLTGSGRRVFSGLAATVLAIFLASLFRFRLLTGLIGLSLLGFLALLAVLLTLLLRLFALLLLRLLGILRLLASACWGSLRLRSGGVLVGTGYRFALS